MSSVIVRSVSIRDLVAGRRPAQVRVELGYPDAVASRTVVDFLAMFPAGRSHWREYVALADGQVVAAVDVHPEPADYRWVLMALSAAMVDDARWPVPYWSALAQHVARIAGLSGAKRLHAAVPIDSPAYEALWRAGFTPYAQQTVLMARGLPVHPGWPEATVRELEPSDAWSVHQLYHLATPHGVQDAEAFTSNHWQTRIPGVRLRRVVMEQNEGLVGYCQVASGRGHHVVELLIRPGTNEIIGPLLAAALAERPVRDSDVVWAMVPDYHIEYLPALTQLGFVPAGRRALMVRFAGRPAYGKVMRWRVQGLQREARRRVGAMPSSVMR